MTKMTPQQCWLCLEKPANRSGLCPACQMRLLNARMKARRMDEKEKRKQARNAVADLFAYGYVRVRLR